MSAGAICFTSSGSNGGCWVVLVPPLPAFLEKGFFFIRNLRQKTSLQDLRQKTSFCQNSRLTPKGKLHGLRQKKTKSGLCLFLQSSYTFLHEMM